MFNYLVTCNHIHLLVLGDGEKRMIPQSMQLSENQTCYLREETGNAYGIGDDSHNDALFSDNRIEWRQKEGWVSLKSIQEQE